MKILSISATNFASYKQIDFDFVKQGLTLIQGPTGSGKSTLCDLPAWILFGKTAKGGTVDEIRSWNSKEPTTGSIRLDSGDVIARSRNPNDLFFISGSNVQSRGRDLGDTQRLINQVLGFDYDLYLAGAYFHEFSQTAQFFTTTAKTRRTICEQLVDLSLAKKLQLKSSEELSVKSKQLASIESKLSTVNSKIEMLYRLEASEGTKAAVWEASHERNKQAVAANYTAFEANRKKIISKSCSSCGTVLSAPKEVIDASPNPYHAQLGMLETQVNPYKGNMKDYSTEISLQIQDQVSLQDQQDKLSLEVDELEALKQVINDYRSVSITNTIKSIEQQTNSFLTNYFDGEIQVNFQVSDADKLEVTLAKDGNECSYTQLSKGQRCLLKLCFGLSVMQAVQNHHGVNFNQIFMDEALDGLDSEMKLKAYRLLESISLNYDSVFVVEHSEALKAEFPNSYSVELINGSSEIAKTT